MWHLALTLFLFSHLAYSDTNVEVELPPIIKAAEMPSSSPGDVIVSSQAFPVYSNGGSGSLSDSIRDQLPLPISATQNPGSLNQFRGLGQNPDDTRVETLGIPLNSGQGGGFDFSAFPQFMWSDFRFSQGPSGGIQFDPGGSAGTLSLGLYTASADQSRFRFTSLYSDAGVSQFSASEKYGDQSALAGYSNGLLKGPSGSVSTKWILGSARGQVHFLGTDLEAVIPGSQTFPTPNAKQRTIRGIPIVQVDFAPNDFLVVRNTAYLDLLYLRSDDPDSGIFTRDHMIQGGLQTLISGESWKTGWSVREVSYQGIGFAPPSEFQSDFQISKWFPLGRRDLLFEPSIQLITVSSFGTQPAASLGLRREFLNSKAHAYFRVSATQRVPSMLDRYYSFGEFYQPNPSLVPEKDYTVLLGTDLMSADVQGTLQMYAQARRNALVLMSSPMSSSVYNVGSARVFSLMHRLEGNLTRWAKAFHSTSLNSSRVGANGSSFPYLPWVTEVVGFRLFPLGSFGKNIELAPSYRVSSYAVADAQNNVPGYGYFDIEILARLWNNYQIVAKAHDVFDRSYEWIRDYPVQRIMTLSLTGEF